MAPDKVTVMILDVDLQCPSCYKKVKKLLCKFPQIRDQVFDEEKNKVRITVVCCNPEKVRDKLCCKGGKAIQRIEIVEDKPKPKPVEKPKQPEKPKPVEKPKEPEKKPTPPPVLVPAPVEKPKEPEKPKPKEPEKKPTPPSVVLAPEPVEKPKKVPPPKPVDPPKKPEPAPMPLPLPPADPRPEPVRMPEPMCGYPPPAFPVAACCPDCYQGRSGGPCEYLYGRPPPGPCYDGYGYAGNRACYSSRCDYYFSEENPQGCWIM